MTYDQALAHLIKCPNEKYICPFCPSLEILGKEMDKHLIDCPNYQEQCPDCNLQVKRCEFDGHDCFTALKKAYALKERQLTETKAEFGLPDTNF